MRLSISTRIFIAFLLVLLLFGGVMGFALNRMHGLRQDLALINRSYLRLALILAELHTVQGNLLNTVAERSAGHGTSKFLRTQVDLARRYRLREAQSALKLLHLGAAQSLDQLNQNFFTSATARLADLEKSFQADEALFDQLFALPSELDENQLREEGEKLLRNERKLAAQLRQLRDELRGQVKAAALRIEESENQAVWAILIMLVGAMLVSLAVTFGAQHALRPLKKLVAGTKRIASGDYGHRVEIKSRDELGELSREFNNMATAIEEREQRLIRSERMATAGQIASHITHEIRNPLNSISLNTELLEEELSGRSDEKLLEMGQICQSIRREVDRLTEITEEYLRFARLPRPHLEPENINDLLKQLVDFVSGEMCERQVEIVRELSTSLPLVDADENQLRQAFLNLLRNAKEAMPEGGKVHLSTAAENGSVLVRIADTGVGIKAEALSKIFEPFFSTKEKGTGLGLALTQQIIGEHGGVIFVDSVVGQGTTFTIKLPAKISTRQADSNLPKC